MNPTRQYDIDFRKEEVEYIMKHVAGSTSCSLVGIGSVILPTLSNPVDCSMGEVVRPFGSKADVMWAT